MGPSWTIKSQIKDCKLLWNYRKFGNLQIYLVQEPSNWRDSKICEQRTSIGEKVMQSHLTMTVKDGVIYEKSL